MPVHKKVSGMFVAALVFLAGCGSNMLEFAADKNSGAAKREAAQIFIDSGDYDAAIAVLASICPNLSCAGDDDAQQFAAAYMGAAGLDVLNLVKQADQNSGSSAQGADFTAVSGLLPAITAANFTKIDSAVTLLSNIGNKTDDQLLQLSIAQLTAAVIAVGQAGGGGFDSDGIPNDCGGDCGLIDVAALIINETLTTADGSTVTVGDYVATQISRAVLNVTSITALVDSDISDQINDLAADMQGSTASTCDTGGGTPSGDLTLTDIDNYLQNCI